MYGERKRRTSRRARSHMLILTHVLMLTHMLILTHTQVSTSRSPGHTKHFQTIFLTKNVVLCDCPGLVFPALDRPKPLQVCLCIDDQQCVVSDKESSSLMNSYLFCNIRFFAVYSLSRKCESHTLLFDISLSVCL